MRDKSGIGCLKRAIFLYGAPASGKSTLGKALAERLGLSFVDLDERIVAEAGMSIPEIFKTRGEAAFRDIESKTLKEVVSGLIPKLQTSNFKLSTLTVVSLGGGTLLRDENRALCEENGTVFCLDTPSDEERGFEAARRQGEGTRRPLRLFSEPRCRVLRRAVVACRSRPRHSPRDSREQARSRGRDRVEPLGGEAWHSSFRNDSIRRIEQDARDGRKALEVFCGKGAWTQGHGRRARRRRYWRSHRLCRRDVDARDRMDQRPYHSSFHGGRVDGRKDRLRPP